MRIYRKFYKYLRMWKLFRTFAADFNLVYCARMRKTHIERHNEGNGNDGSPILLYSSVGGG